MANLKNLLVLGSARFLNTIKGTVEKAKSLDGVLPIANGGTNATTAAAARSNLGIELKNAASGGTDISLVTTGEKYEWNNKVSQVQTGAGLTGGPITSSGTISLDPTVVDSLLTCLEHVAWTDENGQFYYNDLVDALYPDRNIIYRLSAPTEFNGTSDYIDTGIQLMKLENRTSFSVAADFIALGTGSTNTILHAMHEVSPWPGFVFKYDINTVGNSHIYTNVNSSTTKGQVASYNVTNLIGNRTKAVIIVNFTDGIFKMYLNIAGVTLDLQSNTIPADIDTTDVSENLLIGCYQDASGTKGRFFKGTINDLTIYKRILSEAEINRYLQEVHS